MKVILEEQDRFGNLWHFHTINNDKDSRFYGDTELEVAYSFDSKRYALKQIRRIFKDIPRLEIKVVNYEQWQKTNKAT